MSTDTTLDYYLIANTNAVRLGLTPAPGPGLAVVFYETDTHRLYTWNGSAWAPMTGPIVAADTNTAIGLVLIDSQLYKRCTANTAITVTVTKQATVAWADNTTIAFEQSGTGEITFVADTGVTINYGATWQNKIAERYGVAQLVRTGLNTWTLFGALKTA